MRGHAYLALLLLAQSTSGCAVRLVVGASMDASADTHGDTNADTMDSREGEDATSDIDITDADQGDVQRDAPNRDGVVDAGCGCGIAPARVPCGASITVGHTCRVVGGICLWVRDQCPDVMPCSGTCMTRQPADQLCEEGQFSAPFVCRPVTSGANADCDWFLSNCPPI